MKVLYVVALLTNIPPVDLSEDNLSHLIKHSIFDVVGKSVQASLEHTTKIEKDTCLGQFYHFPKIELMHINTLVEVIEDLDKIKHKKTKSYESKLWTITHQSQTKIRYGTNRNVCKKE
ncbi:MAG: hypothetical protein OQK04_11540, partial [Kangiellaceae bacterium]|nr:hypothetical protein [Kangiellaceae bacterium]